MMSVAVGWTVAAFGEVYLLCFHYTRSIENELDNGKKTS